MQEVLRVLAVFFLNEVMSMGTWRNLSKGFTVNECLSDAVANDCLWHVSGCLVRQKGQV